MKIKKRLRKKNHKRFIHEIKIEFSLSNFYRKKIFNLKEKEIIILNSSNINKHSLPKDIIDVINKFDLNYTVECEYVVANYKAFFIFRSLEFMTIKSESCNYNNSQN